MSSVLSSPANVLAIAMAEKAAEPWEQFLPRARFYLSRLDDAGFIVLQKQRKDEGE